MIKRIAALLCLLLLMTGCATQSGSQGEATAGSNRPSDTASAAAEDAAEPEPSAAPADDAPITFGETFTYENDLSVTVSAPTPFTPSEFSSFEEAAAYVQFEVTVVNGTTENYDPSVFFATVQSANVEAMEVFDSENGFNGSPTTTVLPGREAKFKVGYGVQNAADLVFEAAPGFDYNAAIWTT